VQSGWPERRGEGKHTPSRSKYAQAKFSLRKRCVSGCVHLQVYVKRDPDEDLRPVEAELARIAAALPPDQHSYALPYQVPKHHLQTRAATYLTLS
jgi:hypothetical protein